jgi:hypothetical protein
MTTKMVGALAAGWILATAVGACSTSTPRAEPGSAAPVADASSGNTGSLSMKLALPDGEVLGPVQYTLTGAIGTVQSGTLTTANAAGIGFQLGSIPAGFGYTLALSASTDGGATQCLGTAGPLTIVARETLVTTVRMICTEAASSNGNVAVTGVIAYDCGTWQSLSTAGPGIDGGPFTGSEVTVGHTIDLSATASGPVSSELGYAWSTSAPIGLFGVNTANGMSDGITFTCT